METVLIFSILRHSSSSSPWENIAAFTKVLRIQLKKKQGQSASMQLKNFSSTIHHNYLHSHRDNGTRSSSSRVFLPCLVLFNMSKLDVCVDGEMHTHTHTIHSPSRYAPLFLSGAQGSGYWNSH